jgi:nicotinamide riboside kinase
VSDPLVIAIVGAESTGKTVLAAALAQRIGAETGLAATWVPEQLRGWCEREGRTPRRHEQAAIAAAQRETIEAAARTNEVVIADTTPLMIAVYSRLVFDDPSLLAEAAAWQRRCALTLLTSLDLPWVADGLQRDGPHVREPVDALIREALIGHALPWASIGGVGDERIENAIDALAPLLRPHSRARRGLFTRLEERNALDKPWSCELCDDPACEHRALHESALLNRAR